MGEGQKRIDKRKKKWEEREKAFRWQENGEAIWRGDKQARRKTAR